MQSKLLDLPKAVINLANWGSTPDIVIYSEMITAFIILNGKDIQCFNPQFIHHSTLRHNSSDYSNIPEFQNSSNRLIDK
ncbi:46505_t:CDS:2 [Gigaspora margarita]|uniref:46505_t:CDS:1 n=1 Tax=Gigaspora margarita TaxID=4874 RepID=A0ABM8VYS9_GIGMA|nr:46505_t:CDS:2 [Gigaspora margarita]